MLDIRRGGADDKTLPDEEILSLFLSGAEKLQAQVKSLSEADLDLSREANSWTIRQIVHHLEAKRGEHR